MTTAETIVHGALIRTGDPQRPVTDALAIADGVIIALGRAEVEAVKGAGTELVDAGGGVVLPGFQDAHAHPTWGGLARNRCDLSQVHGREDYERLIAQFVRSHPDQEWIVGSGWYGDVFPGGLPSRGFLDALVADRPAVLTSHDGHSVLANTVALERAGIDSDTPHPPGGRIQRDTEGRPTGLLVEKAADLVTELTPKTGARDIEAALLEAQRYMHSLGITAWQDAAVGTALGLPDAYDAYLALARSGALSMKVTGALWWDDDRDTAEQLEFLTQRRAAAPGLTARGGFQATATKIMQDGVCENLTGAVLEPYLRQGEERGLSFIDPGRLKDIVGLLDEHRFDTHIHAVGDRAVREALDALDGSGRSAWDDRHQITHIDLIEESDVQRMGHLGVIANLQPLWARRDPVLVSTKLPYLTPEQRERHFIFRSIRDAGVPLAFSSDWPVSSPDPVWGMHVAVNRTAPPSDPHAVDEESQNRPLDGGQRVDIADAVAAYTRGAARANRTDHVSGRIAVGMAADLVALDRDPHAVEPREVGDLRVTMTMAGGSMVFEGH